MSKYRPSRYIQHSEYATVKTYDIVTASVTVPDTVTVDDMTDAVYSVDIALPTIKGIGWRAIVTSDKYTEGINTPSFLIPCTIDEMGYQFDSFYYGEVLRISPNEAQLRLVLSCAHLGTAIYTNCGQTFTVKLQPYLSPFDA